MAPKYATLLTEAWLGQLRNILAFACLAHITTLVATIQLLGFISSPRNTCKESSVSKQPRISAVNLWRELTQCRMLHNWTGQVRHIMFLGPDHEVIPTSAFVLNCEVRPWPTVAVLPSICVERDVRVAHQDLADEINAVVHMIKLRFHGVLVWVVVPVDKLPEHVETMKLMEDVKGD